MCFEVFNNKARILHGLATITMMIVYIHSICCVIIVNSIYNGRSITVFESELFYGAYSG